MPKPELEKNPKIETRSNSILSCRNFAKEIMHFGQILVKPKNSTNFGPIFWNPKNSYLKNLGILKPEKLKPETPKRQLNSNPKKSKLELDQALPNNDKKMLSITDYYNFIKETLQRKIDNEIDVVARTLNNWIDDW